MQVLLTGSSGFSGSRLALYLAQQQNVDRVIGVDCVEPRVFHPRLSSCVLDLTDWRSFAPLREHRPDVVVHTAADQSSPYLLHANSVAMENLLDYCKEQGVERFVFFSSFYASMRCHNNYRYGKLQSEHALRRSGLRHVVLRPDTIYGHGEPKYRTLQDALRKHVVPVIGNGRYKRTPCYVWDVVTAVHKVISEELYTNDVYDMGSPTAYTWNQMMELMAREIGVARYVSVPLPPAMFKLLFSITRTADADQMNTLEQDRVADPSRFISTFGHPLIDFAEGVSYLCKGDARWPI